MNLNDFKQLKKLEYDDDLSQLKVGEPFLMGENIIEQETKENLNYVCYYVINSKNGNNVTYSVEYEKLKEN